MGIYANPYLLCNIGVYSSFNANVHVAAFRQDYPITDANLVSFMRTESNVGSVEVQNGYLYARIDTYFDSIETTVGLPMETNVDYYGYMVSNDRTIGAFSGKIPHAPPPTVSDSRYELSAQGVTFAGNISDSLMGYTYYVVLSDHDIGAENVETFLSTHNVPVTGNAEAGLINPFSFLLNQPYDTNGNVLPLVQTANQYHAYVHTVNQHMLRETYSLDIPATTYPSPNIVVELVDSFPKLISTPFGDTSRFSEIHQGNISMGNLDGEIVFTTNIASAFSGNTTYYASVYEDTDDLSNIALLRHLYNTHMLKGNLTGLADSGHLQFESYYANTDADVEQRSPLQKDSTYRMALLLLETETNHYSGIRQHVLPTFYPEIEIEHFSAAPIPS